MGFDPSTIKPPRPDITLPSAVRDQRVLTLAQELHRRGVTVSLADAKRLAEGMVDVERKVIVEGSRRPDEPRIDERSRAQSSDLFRAAGVAPPVHAASATVPSLALPQDFAAFVDRVASRPAPHAIEPAVPVAGMPVSPPKEAPSVYGRNEEYRAASVPHVAANKQMFFDDVPPLSQLRGFQQPEALLEGLQFRGFKGTEQARADTPRPVVPIPAPVPVPEPGPEPAPVPTPEPEPEPAPAPVPPVEKQDLAKQHGVDLFEMFRVKKEPSEQ